MDYGDTTLLMGIIDTIGCSPFILIPIFPLHIVYTKMVTMHKLIFFITSGLFIFILWIIYMANTGQSTIFFNFVMSTPYGDKLGHVFLFGFLTLGANISTRLKLVKVGNGNIFLGSLLVTLFVLIEEFSQNYLHTRTLDTLDLFADAIGIITFSIISFYIRKKYFETTSKEYS